MAGSATPMTRKTYRAHALRLTKYAAGVSDPIARAEFVSMASEWRRLAVEHDSTIRRRRLIASCSSLG